MDAATYFRFLYHAHTFHRFPSVKEVFWQWSDQFQISIIPTIGIYNLELVQTY